MKKIKKYLMLLLLLGTLIAFGSVLVSPASFKLSAAVSVLIPVFIALNAVTLLFFLFKRSTKVIYPFVLLVLGYPFLKVSIAFNGSSDKAGDFSLMSYNVKSFHEGFVNGDTPIHNFIIKSAPDIACIQEFKANNRNIGPFKKSSDYNVVVNNGCRDLAILTRFPVIKSGLLFPGPYGNNIQFADIVVKDDTVRVYNAHLQSMGINTQKFQDTEGIREGYEEAKTKFLDGAAIRAEQIDSLLKHVELCAYPVVLAGDLNDVPYSHNHFKLRRNFTNAFESVGNGLGMTYNGRLPFLRIDHQFFSDGVAANSFRTFKEITLSDHFPILGIYSISD